MNANGLADDFDPEKTAGNQKIGQQAGSLGMRLAGDIAEYEQRQAVNDLIKAKSKNDPQAEADAKARLANWGSGGRNKVILHGMIGAATASLGGGNALQGGLGATASEAASGAMQAYLARHDINPDSITGNTLMNLASGAIGLAAGQGAGISVAVSGDKYNRQLHSEESDALAALQTGKTAEEQHRLKAAACALAHCAQGVPESDPDKAKLIALQQEGSQYPAEQAALAQTGLFQYGWSDSTGDFLLNHDKTVSAVENGAQAIGGIAGAASGYTLAAGGCTTGLGCVVAAPVGAAIASGSLTAYRQAVANLNEPYQSEIGQQVIDSFNPETYPGESHPTLNLATNVGSNVLLTGTGATSLKALKYADDWSGAATALGQSIDRATDAARQTRTVGLKIADHVSKQVLGTRMGDGLIAGGSNAAAQLIQNGGQIGQINWIDVGTTTTAGVLGHSRGWKTNVAIGTGAGVTSTEAGNLVHGTDHSLVKGGLVGALGAGTGHGISEGVSGVLKNMGIGSGVSQVFGNISGSVASDAGSIAIRNIGNSVGQEKNKINKNKILEK